MHKRVRLEDGEGRDAYRKRAKRGLDACVETAERSLPCSTERDEALRLGALYAAQLADLALEPKYEPDDAILKIYEAFKTAVRVWNRVQAKTWTHREQLFDQCKMAADAFKTYRCCDIVAKCEVQSQAMQELLLAKWLAPYAESEAVDWWMANRTWAKALSEHMRETARAFQDEYGLPLVAVRCVVL